LQGHSGTIRSISISGDSRLMMSAAEDNTVILWELATNQRVAGFTVEWPLLSCALSPDAQVAVVGDESGQVHFFRLRKPAELNSGGRRHEKEPNP
jgi:WD40 repeat protein